MKYTYFDVSHLLVKFGFLPEAMVFGNTLAGYATALIQFIFLYLAFKVLQYALLGAFARVAKRTVTEFDDTIVRIIQSFRPPFYVFLALYLSLHSLILTPFIDIILTTLVMVWVVYQAVIALTIFVEDIIIKHVAKDSDPTTLSALRILMRIAKGVLWVLGVLILLSQLGVNITSLVAGVGIGGVAIAFALQGILSDLFSSFSIYFDKPFKVGDFIIVGDKMGTVTLIGIKSTRLKALSGEELVISNHVLTTATIQNYKRMQERRVVFSLGVTYDTSSEKMRHALTIVEKSITERKNARLDRVHFSAFAESALTIEAVYYIASSDYNEYMDTQQAINFSIKELFEGEKIEMAFPTRTVHLTRE